MPEIIHSDASILIVNKPSGMPVLPDGWDPQAPYLVQVLEEKFGPLWVVHRLDKVTSGVLLFARSAEAHRALNIQFENRAVEKEYHAFVTGDPPWNQKSARHPLRVNVGHRHRTAVDPVKGKPSVSHFKVLQRFGTHALVEARPETGRTHQIRVHLFALGHPILGDSLYSGPSSTIIGRPALHAWKLVFWHPLTQEKSTFSAAYPDDFVMLLEGANL